jgi:hypothetical protein
MMVATLPSSSDQRGCAITIRLPSPATGGTTLATLPGSDTPITQEELMARDFARSDAYSQSEGRVAKSIEEQTAKLPSDTFLWMAVGAMAASAALQISGNKNVSLFIGQWAPSFLLFGIYNKLVKQLGSDRTENAV